MILPTRNKRAERLAVCLIIHLLVALVHAEVPAQGLTRKVLFLGNSYTYVNNLPLLTAMLAHASGDSLFFDSSTPGGYTLGWQPTAHATDPISLGKIPAENWDFVVLQEQSQIPAIPRLRDSCMIPAATILHDSVKSANPCSRVLFYLTWGRRFGGMQCFTQNYCSAAFSGYDQMQDSLTVACKGAADSLSDWIAPVGEAWRYMITSHGMVLHDADNSHPNLKGSYLAACVFYNVIFNKPLAGNTFTAGLSADTALLLQLGADSVTFGYGNLWNLNNDLPQAMFTLTGSGDTLFTHNLSTGAGKWLWDFGDGQTSTLFEPVHVYAGAGTWTVKLHACNDCFCDDLQKSVTIVSTGTSPAILPGKEIRLLGPDHGGLIKTQGFGESGTLEMVSLTGKTSTVLPVRSGTARRTSLHGGMCIWTLYDRNHVVVARGKIFL